jgi:hypothetical protein
MDGILVKSYLEAGTSPSNANTALVATNRFSAVVYFVNIVLSLGSSNSDDVFSNKWSRIYCFNVRLKATIKQELNSSETRCNWE